MAIEQLTVDGVQYVVAELPQNIQAAVKKYESWQERLTVAQDEVQLVQTGLNSLGNALVTAIREMVEAAAVVNAAQVKPVDPPVAE